MTNRGLRIHTPLFFPPRRQSLSSSAGMHIMDLNCVVSGVSQGISLLKISDVDYVRIKPDSFNAMSNIPRDQAHTIYIARNWDRYENDEYDTALATGVDMQLVDSESHVLEVVEAWPPGLYDQVNRKILIRELPQIIGFIKLVAKKKQSCLRRRHEPTKFLAVYNTIEDLSIDLLEGDSARDFAKKAKSIQWWEPSTAETILSIYLKEKSNQFKGNITFKDKSTGGSHRVSAERNTFTRAIAEGQPERQSYKIKIELQDC